MEYEDDLVSDTELVVLVLNYINQKGWLATATALRTEAAAELGSFADEDAVPGVKTLADVVTEYIHLRQRESKLDDLKAVNPLAASLLNVIELHASQGVPAATVTGAQSYPQTIPQQQHYIPPAAVPAPQPQQQMMLPAHIQMQQQQQHILPPSIAPPVAATLDVETGGAGPDHRQEAAHLEEEYDYPIPEYVPDEEEEYQRMDDMVQHNVTEAPQHEPHINDNKGEENEQSQQQTKGELSPGDENRAPLGMNVQSPVKQQPAAAPAEGPPLSSPQSKHPVSPSKDNRPHEVNRAITDVHQGEQPQQPLVTPSRQVMRKNKPTKRRKLDNDFAVATATTAAINTGSSGEGTATAIPPSPLHGLENVLNMQLDEGGLASLLEDNGLQSRFAQGLAQHITTAMIGSHDKHQQQQNGNASEQQLSEGLAAINRKPDSPECSLFGFPQEGDDDAFGSVDFNAILADLPTDPDMMAILQQFVKPTGDMLLSPSGLTTDSPPTRTKLGQKRRREVYSHPIENGAGMLDDDDHDEYAGNNTEGGEDPRNLGIAIHERQQFDDVVVCEVAVKPPIADEPPIIDVVNSVGVINLRPEDVANLINASLGDLDW